MNAKTVGCGGNAATMVGAAEKSKVITTGRKIRFCHSNINVKVMIMIMAICSHDHDHYKNCSFM